MKIRESGMPDLDLWESFFDPEQILDRLGFNERISNVVEFGCGYGTFTLPAARRARGTVHALDLDLTMLDIARRRADAEGLDNITFLQRDFMAEGSGLDDGTANYAMVFNILHCEAPVALLREAVRIVADGGTVAVIHWAHDRETPRGPPMDMRPSPEQCLAWGREAGLELRGNVINLPPHHFGLLFLPAGA